MRNTDICGDSTWHYYPNDNVCYKMFPDDPTQLKDQWEAQAVCQFNGGCLVTIDSPGKQQFINYLLKTVYTYPPCYTGTNIQYCVWSSGNSTQPSGPWPPIETWQWNCPAPPSTPLSETNFTNWFPGEPNNFSGEKAIMFNQPTTGKWNNFQPTGKMSYMCQKPPISPTTSDYGDYSVEKSKLYGFFCTL